MWPNPQFAADLVTLIEEILMENVIFKNQNFDLLFEKIHVTAL